MKLSTCFYGLLAGLLCACSNQENEELAPLGNEVTVQLALLNWNTAEDCATSRSGSEMVYPIQILLAEDGNDDITKTLTLTSGTEFSLSLASGSYDIYAICGLSATSAPKKISEAFTIPDGNNGKVDFGVGHVALNVSNGTVTPSPLSITMSRQMNWLELVLTDVPTNIATLNVYVQGLHETYSLDNGWSSSMAAVKRFTKIPVAKSGTTYRGRSIVCPSSSSTAVNYVIEAITTSGHSVYMTYTSSTPLQASTHLVQTLKYADLMVVDGGINLSDWIDATDNGVLTTGYAFGVGDQYFSHAATVVHVGTTQILLWPHQPMTVTLSEVRGWADKKHVPYTLLPDVSIQRWSMPQSATTPENIYGNLTALGWDNFDATFTTAGQTPMDRTKTNIIAYYDSATDKFMRYDFQNHTFVDVVDESGTFIFYPVGIIQI